MVEPVRNVVVSLLIVSVGVFCLEFALPIALGEFLAGIVGGFFIDADDLPWLPFISHLGLLSIMFVAGFEVDARILRLNFYKNFIVGILAFASPFTMVFIVGLVAGLPLFEVVILSLSLSTTSLAIVFTIIKNSNLSHKPEGQILLGSAMVVDLVSVIILGILFIDYSLSNLVAMLVLLLVVVTAKRILLSVFARYRGNRIEIELKTILLLLLALSILAEQAGMHAALIAFVVGIILSDIEPDHEEIISKLNTVVFSLLAPLFFFHAGLNIDFHSLGLPQLLILGTVIIVAIVGRYFGAYLGLYYLFAKNKSLAKFGGLLFNYRLSIGIATAMYAFERQSVSVEVQNIILLAIAASSLFTVVAQKWSERKITASEG